MKFSHLKFVIIGYGSIGRKHAKILNKLGIKKIFILSKQKKVNYGNFTKLKNLKKKIVLVEKPLFEKHKSLIIKNNKVLVGYNLRFHPVLNKIKKIIKNKQIWFASSNCMSYLPDWRKNIEYHKSTSAQKKLGGGVRLELSHECDYLLWLFNDLKLKYSFNKKISNLKINTDDILHIICSSKKLKYLSLKLNFFSKLSERNIHIEANNLSIFADFKNFEMKISNKKNNKEKLYKVKKIDLLELELRNLIQKNFSKFCSYKEGVKVNKFLDKVKNFQGKL